MGFITGLLKAGYGTAKFGAKTGLGAAKMGARSVGPLARAGLWGVRHPYITAGALGAGAYATMGPASTPYSSPTLEGTEMSLRMDQEAGAVEAMNTGIAPTGNISSGAAIRNQRLMESTMGLTQGLHRSRH